MAAFIGLSQIVAFPEVFNSLAGPLHLPKLNANTLSNAAKMFPLIPSFAYLVGQLTHRKTTKDTLASKKMKLLEDFLSHPDANRWFFAGTTVYINKDFLNWLGARDLRQSPIEVGKPPDKFFEKYFLSHWNYASNDERVLGAAPVTRGDFLEGARSASVDGDNPVRAFNIDLLFTYDSTENGTLIPKLNILVRLDKEPSRIKVKQDVPKGLRTLIPNPIRESR